MRRTSGERRLLGLSVSTGPPVNISLTVTVNGVLLEPPVALGTSIPEVDAVPVRAPREEIDLKVDRATPVIPLGSSVLAPGLEAALEF